jgi:hypothetical protein
LLLLLLLLLLLFLLRFFVFFFRVEGSASKGIDIERDLCAYKTNACSSSIRLKFVSGIFLGLDLCVHQVWALVTLLFFISPLCACVRVCACARNLGSFGLLCPLFAFDTFELCLPSLFLVGFPLHIGLKVVSPLDFREWLYSG